MLIKRILYVPFLMRCLKQGVLVLAVSLDGNDISHVAVLTHIKLALQTRIREVSFVLAAHVALEAGLVGRVLLHSLLFAGDDYGVLMNYLSKLHRNGLFHWPLFLYVLDVWSFYPCAGLWLGLVAFFCFTAAHYFYFYFI